MTLSKKSNILVSAVAVKVLCGFVAVCLCCCWNELITNWYVICLS